MLNNKILIMTITAVMSYFVCSCQSSSYKTTAVEAHHIEISPSTPVDETMQTYLAPMVDSMNAVMDRKLSYSPSYVNKREQELGAWLADLSIEQIEKYMAARGEKVDIDVALFNSGGMRTHMPQGDISVGWVYEFMPFDNAYVILELDNTAMREMFTYLSINAVKGTYHPLGGMRLVYNTHGYWDRTTTIGPWRLTPGKKYTILTSDFLHKGGDNMTFLAEGRNVRYLPLKMRDVIMDYVSFTDTLNMPKNKRYHEIK